MHTVGVSRCLQATYVWWKPLLELSDARSRASEDVVLIAYTGSVGPAAAPRRQPIAPTFNQCLVLINPTPRGGWDPSVWCEEMLRNPTRMGSHPMMIVHPANPDPRMGSHPPPTTLFLSRHHSRHRMETQEFVVVTEGGKEGGVVFINPRD
jgi:hypothetical protein